MTSFVPRLLKRSWETKIDIALVHLCDFRHCVPALLDRKLCDKSNYSFTWKFNTNRYYVSSNLAGQIKQLVNFNHLFNQ